MGIVHDIALQELRLYTDFGRCSRPLFVVEDGRLLIRKQHITNIADEVTYLEEVRQVAKRRDPRAPEQPLMLSSVDCFGQGPGCWIALGRDAGMADA